MFKCNQCQSMFFPLRTNKNCIRKFCSVACSSKHSTKRQIKKCLYCKTNTLNPKFCCKSCRASHLNTGRILSDSTKLKIRTTLLAKYEKVSVEYLGEYTRIYLCKCKFTGKTWYSKTVKTIHPDIIDTKKQYSYQCRFNFGISSYPDWFQTASGLIQNHGWYSTPGSRKGIKNINGISRDHMYSVTHGFKNNVDPCIISHPANCQLMQHVANQSKNTQCSLSLLDLMAKIEEFDKMYPASPFRFERKIADLEFAVMPSFTTDLRGTL